MPTAASRCTTDRVRTSSGTAGGCCTRSTSWPKPEYVHWLKIMRMRKTSNDVRRTHAQSGMAGTSRLMAIRPRRPLPLRAVRPTGFVQALVPLGVVVPALPLGRSRKRGRAGTTTPSGTRACTNPVGRTARSGSGRRGRSRTQTRRSRSRQLGHGLGRRVRIRLQPPLHHPPRRPRARMVARHLGKFTTGRSGQLST
jgi:hypothetical protein